MLPPSYAPFSGVSAGVVDSTMGYPAKSMRAFAQAAKPYTLALAAIVIAYGLSILFLHFHLPQPFAVLALCAIAITFWSCGTGPGILATLLAMAVRNHFFFTDLRPAYLLAYDAVFVLFAMLMMEATKARHKLEATVATRTQDLSRANEYLKREIADRVRAEEKLKQSEAYLEEAQRLAHIGSYVWRIEGRQPVYLSDEYFRIWGFNPENGVPSWDDRVQRVHPEDREKWISTLERAIAEKSQYEFEYRIVLPSGTMKYLYAIGHPVLDASGNLTEFVGTMADITERKSAEQEHERLNQLQANLAHTHRVTTMGELTASLAHEINQPIAATVTNANTCVRWLAGDRPNIEEARDAANRAAKDAKRAAEIISRTRQLFKKGGAERELIEINEIIREMITLLLKEANHQSVAMCAHFGVDLPLILGDRVQLQQVLMNLMMNGIDAMKGVSAGRELTIQSTREDHQLVVSVADTGMGLPGQADKIFDAFFTTKTDGTGMGLSISRSIIESHGGRLWAVNNSSRGSTFFFTLPIAEEAR